MDYGYVGGHVLRNCFREDGLMLIVLAVHEFPCSQLALCLAIIVKQRWEYPSSYMS